MKKLLAEFLGTFALVFAGTGAIVINHFSGGAIGHAGIALTFGLDVMAMIHTFGDVSGAHLNPAVTIAFLALLACVQALRLVLGWRVDVNGVTIPLWASALAIVVVLSVATALWREACHPIS